MRVNVCIPTRNKAEYLPKFLPTWLDRSALPDTRFVIGCDEDDETISGSLAQLPISDKIIISRAPREDALGAKYNRCAAAYDADIYVMAVDDVGITTVGWDKAIADTSLLFTDGIGVIGFGVDPYCYVPQFLALTRKFVELNGFFMPPYFPFWWHNTWTFEVAEMTGRILPCPVGIVHPPVFPAAPRRDVGFWAKFFDETRQLRAGVADRIMAETNDQPWFKHLQRKARPLVMDQQMKRGAVLRDPNFAMAVEVQESLPQPLDERHKRLKDQAMEILLENKL